jgi:hypothetical protein
VGIIQFVPAPQPRPRIRHDQISQAELHNFAIIQELIMEYQNLQRLRAAEMRDRLLAGAGVEPGPHTRMLKSVLQFADETG